MNQVVKIAKLEIPVDEDVKVLLEGLEIKVEGLDLRDYLIVMKEMPAIVREMVQIVKEVEGASRPFEPTMHSLLEDLGPKEEKEE